ncbi:energy transducer TonB [Microbulbifer pacificus]|uniref:Energy transducer TonB n=1 Tax=Microbulbifer pacificus TaxID=407164 RepID=A0AAU0MVQ4_9GAMM|nr:energy transducer TonB [Microbulbifer pacificus]WOX04538.1 energy transducer TonB [Microbulbifer pacificus]
MRLTVMLICSFVLHLSLLWALLWAAPAQEVQGPSGTVALKLGQMRLATEVTQRQSAEKPAEQKSTAKPEPVAQRAPAKVIAKEPVKKQSLKQQVAQVSMEKTQPIANEAVTKPEAKTDSGAEASVATAQQNTQQSVSEEPVLIERPAFASPPGAPVYPELARQRRQQGTVVVEVQLDRTGAQVLRRLLQSSGVDSLDESALNAVASWEFLPYREGGRARLSRVRLPIRFSL